MKKSFRLPDEINCQFQKKLNVQHYGKQIFKTIILLEKSYITITVLFIISQVTVATKMEEKPKLVIDADLSKIVPGEIRASGCKDAEALPLIKALKCSIEYSEVREFNS